MNDPKPSGSVPMPKPTRGGLKGFYREVMKERRNISWPTRQETFRLTGVVLGVCGIFIVLITAASYLSDAVIRLITTGGRGA